jgi:hypothetical protein
MYPPTPTHRSLIDLSDAYGYTAAHLAAGVGQKEPLRALLACGVSTLSHWRVKIRDSTKLIWPAGCERRRRAGGRKRLPPCEGMPGWRARGQADALKGALACLAALPPRPSLIPLQAHISARCHGEGHGLVTAPRGSTPLHLAARRGDRDMVELLLRHWVRP